MKSNKKNSEFEGSEKQINPESYIKGTTLEIYYYILRKKSSVGVREVQRELSLSSPSVASYHLEKLVELNVLTKSATGNYEIRQKLDIGSLNQFVLIGNYTLPRFLFYAVFFTVILVGYILLFFNFPLTTSKLFVFIFSFGSTIIFWFETIKSWKKRPF